MSIASSYSKLDRLLASIGSFLQPVLLLVIRLYWGWSFFQTGKAKLSNIPAFVDRFTNWGVPLPKINVVLAGGTECICGLLLLAGLFSRVVSVPLMFTMTIAYLTAESEALHAIVKDTDKFTSATPFLFLLAALIIFIFGPGKLSLDALFFGTKSASAK
jgi:putative oxidoreductase